MNDELLLISPQQHSAHITAKINWQSQSRSRRKYLCSLLDVMFPCHRFTLFLSDLQWKTINVYILIPFHSPQKTTRHYTHFCSIFQLKKCIVISGLVFFDSIPHHNSLNGYVRNHFTCTIPPPKNTSKKNTEETMLHYGLPCIHSFHLFWWPGLVWLVCLSHSHFIFLLLLLIRNKLSYF